MADRPPISACMIVRNEIEMLPGALRSLHGAVSQIIVLDTGSTDGTPQLATEMGATVAHFRWCDDFSAARNASIALATKPWIIYLDADERLLPAGAKAIAKAARTPTKNHGWVLSVEERNLDDSARGAIPSLAQRMLRNLPMLKFHGRLHEEPWLDGDRRAARWEPVGGGPHIRHYGYDPIMLAKRSKHMRNIGLLTQQLRERGPDALTMYLLARQQMAGGEPVIAATWARRCLQADPELRALTPSEADYVRRIA